MSQWCWTQYDTSRDRRERGRERRTDKQTDRQRHRERDGGSWWSFKWFCDSLAQTQTSSTAVTGIKRKKRGGGRRREQGGGGGIHQNVNCSAHCVVQKAVYIYRQSNWTDRHVSNTHNAIVCLHDHSRVVTVLWGRDDSCLKISINYWTTISQLCWKLG